MRRNPALFAIVAALALPMCGVSGDDDAQGPGQVTTTEPGGSETTTEETTTTSEVIDEDLDQVLADAGDDTIATTSFTIDSEAQLDIGFQELVLGVTGSVDYEAYAASIEIMLDEDGTTSDLEILSDGETLWVRVESADVTIPEGKTWVEGDADRLVEASTFDPDGVLGVLYALRAAEGTEVGDTEEIDGVETTQYTTEIDYAAAVEAAGDDAAAFQAALSLTGTDDIALLVDAWVGDDGVIRRFELEVDAGTAPLGGTYRIELSDVGEEVGEVESPPAADTLTGPQAETLLDQLIT